MGITRWSNRYQSCWDPQAELRMRLRELAASRARYRYRRLTVLLRREGREINAKRVYRLYREEGLQARTKKRAKRASHVRVPLPSAVRANKDAKGHQKEVRHGFRTKCEYYDWRSSRSRGHPARAHRAALTLTATKQGAAGIYLDICRLETRLDRYLTAALYAKLVIAG